MHTTFKILTTILSPVHIGTGEQLTAVGEYLTTQTKIYFLKHEDLMVRLNSANLLDDYTNKILDAGNNFDFEKVLREEYEISYLEENLVDRALKLVEKDLSITSNNNLSVCIKTAQKAYLPGSSIKGMLRTAILFNVLKKDRRLREKAESALNSVFLYNSDNLLNKINTQWRELENGSKKNPEAILPEMVFKSIRPYDSTQIDDSGVSVYQVYRQHLYDTEVGGVDWLVESIEKDSKLNFDFTLNPVDIEKYSNFPFIQTPNIESLFNIINDCSLTIIDFELDIINATKAPEDVKLAIRNQLENYKKEIESASGKYAFARIGKGKSIFYQTILSILRDDIREKIIELLMKEKTNFPQSIVLTAKDYQMMGWVKLEVAGVKAIEDKKSSAKQSPSPENVETTTKPVKVEVKKIPLEDRKIFNNEITVPIQVGTELSIYFYEPGKIKTKINEQLFENVQLSRSKYKIPKPGELIKVIIKQYSEAKGFIQLSII